MKYKERKISIDRRPLLWVVVVPRDYGSGGVLSILTGADMNKEKEESKRRTKQRKKIKKGHSKWRGKNKVRGSGG